MYKEDIPSYTLPTWLGYKPMPTQLNGQSLTTRPGKACAKQYTNASTGKCTSRSECLASKSKSRSTDGNMNSSNHSGHKRGFLMNIIALSGGFHLEESWLHSKELGVHFDASSL